MCLDRGYGGKRSGEDIFMYWIMVLIIVFGEISLG